MTETMANLELHEFKTPHGRPVRFNVRAGTSDWDTCNSINGWHDEYHMPTGLVGWALDVGAHIGGCTVSLLLDNPDLWVVAIEALPENVELLRANLELNGVRDRCVVIEGAAGDGSPAEIRYGTDGTHEFIGNIGGSANGRTTTADGVSLADVLGRVNGYTEFERFAWAKTDCEGCEYGFLATLLADHIDHIEGEFHGGGDRLAKLLDATHEVTFTESRDAGFGAFTAVRR